MGARPGRSVVSAYGFRATAAVAGDFVIGANVWTSESIVVDVSGTDALTIRFRGTMNKSNKDAYVDQVEVTAQ